MKKTVINIWLLALVAANLFSQQSDFPKLTGPYLGQKPPGKTPESFAPDIPELHFLHGMIRFSPNGNEAYWKPAEGTAPILVSKNENGQWTRPKTASFSVGSYIDDSPFFSPDGKKLFFISQRPLSGEGQAPINASGVYNYAPYIYLPGWKDSSFQQGAK